jgi:hypothetical protein
MDDKQQRKGGEAEVCLRCACLRWMDTRSPDKLVYHCDTMHDCTSFSERGDELQIANWSSTYYCRQQQKEWPLFKQSRARQSGSYAYWEDDAACETADRTVDGAPSPPMSTAGRPVSTVKISCLHHLLHAVPCRAFHPSSIHPCMHAPHLLLAS